jgi:REP-associated tyrosine transposase
MRTARKKIIGKGCYYHLMNRLAGYKHDHPFTDIDREHGMHIVAKLSEYYLLEFISMCWMGNHFHIVLYAPSKDELPDNNAIAARHNNYYNNQLDKTIEPDSETNCAVIAEKMIDISHFMKIFQQSFVVYYNRAHKRQGHLWADRFKSVILDKTGALWAAVKYVELNPVRAELVTDPADYRHSTWGWFCGSGKHLFAESFFKHMQNCGQLSGNIHNWQDLITIFRSELARTIAYEAGQNGEELFETVQKAKKGVSMPLRYLRRTRHWTDGGIIGSKEFILNMAAHFVKDKEKLLKKQLSCGKTDTGEYLYCFKRLSSQHG